MSLKKWLFFIVVFSCFLFSIAMISFSQTGMLMSVSGHVFNKTLGKPIKDARITIQNTELDKMSFEDSLKMENLRKYSFSKKTDSNGYFRINTLKEGSYQLLFTLPNGRSVNISSTNHPCSELYGFEIKTGVNVEIDINIFISDSMHIERNSIKNNCIILNFYLTADDLDPNTKFKPTGKESIVSASKKPISNSFETQILISNNYLTPLRSIFNGTNKENWPSKRFISRSDVDILQIKGGPYDGIDINVNDINFVGEALSDGQDDQNECRPIDFKMGSRESPGHNCSDDSHAGENQFNEEIFCAMTCEDGKCIFSYIGAEAKNSIEFHPDSWYTERKWCKFNPVTGDNMPSVEIAPDCVKDCTLQHEQYHYDQYKSKIQSIFDDLCSKMKNYQIENCNCGPSGEEINPDCWNCLDRIKIQFRNAVDKAMEGTETEAYQISNRCQFHCPTKNIFGSDPMCNYLNRY